MSLSKRKAGLVAAAAMAASVAAMPLSAHEQSFSGLESLGAQPLSTADMAEVHGQAYALAVAALLSYAAKIQATTTTQPQVATQVAAQYTAIAAALSAVTVPTTRIVIRTSTSLTLVRR